MSEHKNLTYTNTVIDLFNKIDEQEQSKILAAAEVFAKAIMENKIIHTFGTGHSHMIGIELFARAGGLANVNAMLDPDVISSNGARRSSELERLPGLAKIIFDHYNINDGDVMVVISNSGRNAVPIEMAKLAQEKGLFVIAVTNMAQSQAAISRHPSGKKMYEYADLVLDTLVPSGDASLAVGNSKTGPVSTLNSILILNNIVYEALKIVADKGHDLPIFQSQNVDGFDNDALYAKYEDRVKHF